MERKIIVDSMGRMWQQQPYQQQQAGQAAGAPMGVRSPAVGRGYIERYQALTAQPCVNAGPTVFSKELPLGEGWYVVVIRLNEVFVVGTGTTPIAEGELLYVKNIQLRTDHGEIICNLPGRALYKIATYKSGTPPLKDAIAAASATYTVTLPIYIAEMRKMNMLRLTDTILNTARYNTVTLQVSLGSTADLLGTPGTSTVTTSIDVELHRSFGALPWQALPLFHESMDFRPPVDASTTLSVDLERSADMSIKRLFVHSCTGGSAGVPYSGVNSDAVQNQIIVRDQNRFIEFQRIHAIVQRGNQQEQGLAAAIVGLEVYDFVNDGSIASAMATAEKSILQYTFTTQAGQVANNLVTVAMEMIRVLK